MRHLHRKRLNFKIDAGNLRTAVSNLAARALAKFGEPDVSALAQFQAGGDQHAVNVDTRLAFKLKQHAHAACVVGAPAQDPAPATQNRPRERLDKPRRLRTGNGLHLHRPGNGERLPHFEVRHAQPHCWVIGAPAKCFTAVPESNGP
jgi:hypothetical protein